MATVFLPEKTVSLVAVECYKCGVVFGIPQDLERNRRQDKESFWCPNGHSQAYTKSEADRLRDQLAQEKHNREQAEARVKSLRVEVADRDSVIVHQDRRINGYKGCVARVKRRVSKGRCPCCSHQFKDLERHMQTQHPTWEPERAAEALADK